MHEDREGEEKDYKKYWEKINLILPNKNKQNTINLTNKETGEPTDIHDTADFINEHFVKIGPKLAPKLVTKWI